jgi:hypothetical protein
MPGGTPGWIDVHERDAGEAEEPDDGVGVVDLGAAAEGELHVAPHHAGIGTRGTHSLGAHLDGRLGAEAAEGVQPDPDDGDVVHGRSPQTGLRA